MLCNEVTYFLVEISMESKLSLEASNHAKDQFNTHAVRLEAVHLISMIWSAHTK